LDLSIKKGRKPQAAQKPPDLLLAVLEERVGYRLYNVDVFVSIVGGMRLQELRSTSGSSCDRLLFFRKSDRSRNGRIGEVGLAGEVRSVLGSKARLKEAIKWVSKKRFFLSRTSKDSFRFPRKISLTGVGFVEEAIQAAIS